MSRMKEQKYGSGLYLALLITKRGKFSGASWGFDVVMLNSRQWEVPEQKRSQIYDIVSIFTHFCAFKRDVSTAYCRSSSGDRVDLLSRTICSTVVVSSWMVGGFRTIKVLLALSEEKNVPSAVRSGTANLLTYTQSTFSYVRCFRKPTRPFVASRVQSLPLLSLSFLCWSYRRYLRYPYFLSIYRTGERICNLYSHFITDGRYFLKLVYWWPSRKSYIHP